ncbi:MAG TPA: methyltransferase domain-containing protein [Polyangiaceae bacterium]|jgi:SAM-dependent methyltransferase|nr:methyltransferase domain-containing protein [Polyangiaceae bacterium]
MTIDNSDETARASASEAAEAPAAELSSVRATADAEDVDLSVLDAPHAQHVLEVSKASGASEVVMTHDSVSPSRKLAPPPKPRRDSGPTSGPPSVKPPADASIDSAFASSALKAPIAPTISYSAEGASNAVEELADSASDVPALPPVPGSAPLSSPPPIRRRSNPGIAIADAADGASPSTARSPSDPSLTKKSDPAIALGASDGAQKSAASPPRPVAAPPRPASNPPPRPASNPPARPASNPPLADASSEPPPSSAPPSSSAIFAMRIIAVGESRQSPPVVADHSADPTAYPAALGKRRSSRPAPAPAAEAPAPLDSSPDISEGSVPAPIVDLAPTRDAVPEPEVKAAPAAVLAPASPSDEVTEELSDEDVSPDSSEKKKTAPEVPEPDREEPISVPPEELAALQESDPQAQPKSDAKPPPPPKRAAPAVPPAPALESVVAPSQAPPTPDPAAAKAAQRAKTRQPWWEDLFNEDFMRASFKVNDEQVRREVTFIEDSLGVAAGGIVLDLGCGAGHHAVEFASRGYGVVGYDLSLYQLALAADVAQERSQKINFLQGDMREMAFEEMFDGVFCWNTSFGYFEEDKNLAVAQRVFRALRPGGMFLIDVVNRDFVAASAPQQVWYEGDACVCMDDMSVDYISSRLRVKRSIILDDGRTKESMFSLRLYSLHELGKLLHEVGFRVTEASGHPTTPGVFFGPNSPRIIILAQRP